MLVRGFPAGAFGTNCYVVAPGDGEHCVVIDPGQDAVGGVEDLLREHRLRPVAVLLTHGHIDHMWSVMPVCGAHGIPAYIHPDDRAMLTDPLRGMSQSIGLQLGDMVFTEPDDVVELPTAGPIELAGMRFVVDLAPGHTQGSITFRTPGLETGGEPAAPVMFSGDLLFAGSIGRTDLPGGDWGQMQRSLAEVVLPLPDDTVVLPGHGPSTTIERERATNPYLRELAGGLTVFSAPKGTYDILPGSAFGPVRDALLEPARLAGYSYVEAPVFEDTELFVRGVGASTDVVSKEMFSFTDRGGRSLTLRPEGTAGVLRAVLEAGLQTGQLPVKLRYAGPMFRAERPQAGRFRQFQQVGIEALGTDDAALDAEVVALAWQGYADLGLKGARLLLTSLGDATCRPGYRATLTAYLAGLDLDADTRRRAELNPLRVLDDKREQVQAQLGDAPLMTDALCEPCRNHHAAVQAHLDDLGITYEAAPRLVRGLDYYTRTTFEFVHDGLGAQSAVGGGGRYDGLSQDIGGPPLPGIGWSLGVERTLLALESEGVLPAVPPRAQVFFVPLGAAAKSRALVLVTALRTAGVAADLAYGDRGMKGAMKAADRSGATYAVVLGDRDLAAGVGQLKDLRSGGQDAVRLEELVSTVKGRLL